MFSIREPWHWCQMDKDDKFTMLTGASDCIHKFGHLSKCDTLYPGDKPRCHFEPRSGRAYQN